MARTVDEILRGLRGLIVEDESVHSGDQIDADAVHHAIQKFADELEAALKREKSQSWHNREMEELILRHEKEVAELKKQIGNAAALREAMLEIANIADDWERHSNTKAGALDSIYELANTALAAQPRQCDIGTPEEQKERFDSFCNAQPRKRCVCDCILQKNCQGLCEGLCEFAWAQMPYEQEGDAK